MYFYIEDLAIIAKGIVPTVTVWIKPNCCGINI